MPDWISRKPRPTLHLMADDSSSPPKLSFPPCCLPLAASSRWIARGTIKVTLILLLPPPGAPRPARCPSLIIPQTTKKKKKGPPRPGLAKSANKERDKAQAMCRPLNHPTLQPLLHHLLHHHGHEFRPPSPWPLADRGTPAPRHREARPRSSFQPLSGVEKLRFGQAAPLARALVPKNQNTQNKGRAAGSPG